MKYLELYEDFDWDDEDFDWEEEGPKFEVGDKIYLPTGKHNISTNKYYKRDKYRIIDKIRKMKDGTPIFRLKGEWHFRKFDNWIKKQNNFI